MLDVLRGIDILIWALIFVSAVGMGPFAGVLAIAFSDVAFLTKIYAEAIENVDRKPIEGTQAAGANRLQTIRLAVVPQVLPVILSSALYFFESNVRAATILGIVGAGGIGLQLSQQILVNNWDQALLHHHHDAGGRRHHRLHLAPDSLEDYRRQIKAGIFDAGLSTLLSSSINKSAAPPSIPSARPAGLRPCRHARDPRVCLMRCCRGR